VTLDACRRHRGIQLHRTGNTGNKGANPSVARASRIGLVQSSGNKRGQTGNNTGNGQGGHSSSKDLFPVGRPLVPSENPDWEELKPKRGAGFRACSQCSRFCRYIGL
jgi:hypothetical protein